MATGKALRSIGDVSGTVAGTADITYSANEVTLINDLVTQVNIATAKVNELLGAMRERGWVDR